MPTRPCATVQTLSSPKRWGRVPVRAARCDTVAGCLSCGRALRWTHRRYRRLL